MKIKVIHDECGREVLVRQILDSEGHCPWDGKPFTRDYTAVLAEALEQAEIAGGVMENVLDKIAGMEPSFAVDRASLLGDLEELLARINHREKNRP